MAGDDDPTKPDLSLVDANDLIAELKRRVTALVIAWERPDKTEENVYRTMTDWGGSPNTCLGLVERLQDEMWDELRGQKPDGELPESNE